MKKRKTRFLKRLFILVLCVCLVSGTVINKNKISAHAAGLTLTLGSYTAYEICLYVGTLLIGSLGIGVAIDNRDEIAEVGKKFIDSMDLEGISDWLFTKVNTAGQSYVYGTEALQEIQDMSFSVIQGGGNRPDDDDDNNEDEDGEHMLDVQGLGELAVFGTVAFYDLFEQYLEPLIDKVRAGEENIVAEVFPLNDISFTEYQMDDAGNYLYNGSFVTVAKQDLGSVGAGSIYDKYILRNLDSNDNFYYSKPLVCYISYMQNGNTVLYNFAYYENNYMKSQKMHFDSYSYRDNFAAPSNGEPVNFTVNSTKLNCIYNLNIPLFPSLESAREACSTGDFSAALNTSKVYRIADWLQEDWAGLLESLNMGIRSLNENLLIVGDAANQALQNQLNGLGYISAIDTGISNSLPLDLPGIIEDPIYYPADSGVPKLDDDKLPWNNPEGVPGTSPGGGDPNPPDSDEGNTDDDNLDPKDSFGLNTLFGILIILIEILITLLIIFLSCLVFITTIFRIPPQQGFLPDEMVMSLEYLKTLIIPGLGISVWSFFMALIYIILIFTVIGILRKNIDKIRFPRRRI